MTAPSITVRIEDAAWRASLPGAVGLVRRAATAALDRDASGGLTALLTGDEAVRRLNAAFRGKDAPTNVLAFPALANPEGYLGDIALARGVCAGEAAEQGKSLADHVRHLVIHAVLHLRGHDHQEDSEATDMEALERVLLARMGVLDPYRGEGNGRPVQG